MELPAVLRQAIDRALNGVPLDRLAAASAALSQRYRQERRDGRLHVATETDALAYLATRLPATYAAVRASFAAIARARPDFAPNTMLDIGAGPGTALWAAADCWPDLADALLIEASAVFRSYGGRLAVNASLPQTEWRVTDVINNSAKDTPRDLVTAAYVLNELNAADRSTVVDRLWRATADILVIVEPGTPAGWQRILSARGQLLELGAFPIAPCPHAWVCPLAPPDWCHFAERLPRSRLHRQAKGAEVPWEDEKFGYLAASRHPTASTGARIIAPPRKASGRVTLKLCRADGSAAERLFSRRDGEPYKRATRGDWGGTL